MQQCREKLIDDILQRGYDEGLISKKRLNYGIERNANWAEIILKMPFRREQKAVAETNILLLETTGLISKEEKDYLQNIFNAARFEKNYYKESGLSEIGNHLLARSLELIVDGWSTIQLSDLQNATEKIPQITDLAERFNTVQDIDSAIEAIKLCSEKLREKGFHKEADLLFVPQTFSGRIELVKKSHKKYDFLKEQEHLLIGIPHLKF